MSSLYKSMGLQRSAEQQVCSNSPWRYFFVSSLFSFFFGLILYPPLASFPFTFCSFLPSYRFNLLCSPCWLKLFPLALAIALEGRTLYFGNVGDCRAVIGDIGGKGLAVTEDLNCENEREVARIRELGGMVCDNMMVLRVLMILAPKLGRWRPRLWITCCNSVNRRWWL